MAEAFTFELVSPEELVLSAEASAVSVPGSEGYFTVMANHAAFMTTVKPGVVDVTMDDGGSKKIYVRGGFADVSPSGLTLLAEHATDLAEFDMADLDAQIEAAKSELADASDERKEKAAKALAELEDSKAAVALAQGGGH